MKILAVTHGPSLEIAIRLSSTIRDKLPHELSLIASDSSEYDRALHDPTLADIVDEISVLKEWDLFEDSRGHDSSEKETTYWEDLIREPLMWSILSDRNLMTGRYSRHQQNYQPWLSDERMIQVVSYAYKAIDEFFYQVGPDIVLAFGMTRYCEYIARKIAAKHDVPFHMFSTNQFGCNLTMVNSVAEWPRSVWKRFRKTSHLLDCNNTLTLDNIDRAQTYVRKVQEHGFQGCNLSENTGRFEWIRAGKALLLAAITAMTKGRDPVRADDHYLEGYIKQAFHREVMQPIRIWRKTEYLKDRYIDPDTMKGGHRRIFFPLYHEAEVPVQTYGPLYQNQIELVRQLAYASPADCEILVKDHPGSYGLRKLSYYKKLLEIPKVRLVSPHMPSNKAIALCNAVVVIAGQIGLEAAIIGLPVLVLGKPPYRHLGAPHFHTIKNPWKLHKTIEKLLDPNTSDAIRRAGEEVFIRLLSILQEESCPAELETVFLQRGGRQKADMFGEQMSKRQQREALVSYICEKLSVIREKKQEKVA